MVYNKYFKLYLFQYSAFGSDFAELAPLSFRFSTLEFCKSRIRPSTHQLATKMTLKNALALALVSTSLLSGVAQAAIDTRDINIAGPGITYWVPSVGLETTSPYYRGASGSWGWTHGAIAGATSATLSVSAFDVDFSSGEIDNISAFDATTNSWVLLGALAGGNNVFSFTNFGLGANLLDDVANGLQVKIDISAGASGWLTSLSKSVLTTEGENTGNPNPTAVPDFASTLLMFGAAASGLIALRKRLS